MALFGAPTAHEDDPERAVRARPRHSGVCRRGRDRASDRHHDRRGAHRARCARGSGRDHGDGRRRQHGSPAAGGGFCQRHPRLGQDLRGHEERDRGRRRRVEAKGKAKPLLSGQPSTCPCATTLDEQRKRRIRPGELLTEPRELLLRGRPERRLGVSLEGDDGPGLAGERVSGSRLLRAARAGTAPVRRCARVTRPSVFLDRVRASLSRCRRRSGLHGRPRSEPPARRDPPEPGPGGVAIDRLHGTPLVGRVRELDSSRRHARSLACALPRSPTRHRRRSFRGIDKSRPVYELGSSVPWRRRGLVLGDTVKASSSGPSGDLLLGPRRAVKRQPAPDAVVRAESRPFGEHPVAVHDDV